jgi:urease accessory protein
MKNARFFAQLLLLAALGVCGVAQAHPGHATPIGFAAGLMHPLLGLDHLLAALAVGMWAARQHRSGRWLVPGAFLVALLGGVGLAALNVGLPLVEPVIAGSLLVLGLLLIRDARLVPASGMAVVALLALFHGYAHGVLAPTAPYVLGLMLTTGLLLLVGRALGIGLSRARADTVALPWLRTGGMVITAVGVVLLAGA